MSEQLLQLWEGNRERLEELINGGIFIQDLLSGCQRLKLQVFACWLIFLWSFHVLFAYLRALLNVVDAMSFHFLYMWRSIYIYIYMLLLHGTLCYTIDLILLN